MVQMIKDLPDCEKPIERGISLGFDSLSSSELMGIIIGTGSKEKSAIALSTDIIKSIDSISDLSNVTLEELCVIKGIGRSKGAKIIAAVNLGQRIYKSDIKTKLKITSPEDVYNAFSSEMSFLKREEFRVILLNTKNSVISTELISIGSLNSSIVHPREVFNKAIKKNSASVILIHNHPSGNPSPSKEDLVITRRLMEAGDIIGIKVLDHIIIGHGKFHSLKENDEM